MATETETPTAEQEAERLIAGEETPEERAQTEAARGAGELATRDDFTIAARHQFDRTQVEVIKQTVAKDCSPPELAMFLEIAARYGLDPFMREIFAAKFDGDRGSVTIFVPRDGLLKSAKQRGQFVRMESHVVRENDEYEITVDTSQAAPEGMSQVRQLRHVQKGMGAQRGEIVGAYALLWVTGQKDPWFHQATWEDYGAKKHKSEGKNPWKQFTEAMMLKVPESYILRKACGLTGVVGEDEVRGLLHERERQDLSGSGETVRVEYPESELGLTVQALVERANELAPGSYRPAKVAMELGARTDEDLAAFRDRLRAFVTKRAPDDPLVIADATVVAEPEPAEEVTAEALPEWNEQLYNTIRSSALDLESQLDEQGLSEEQRARAEADLAVAEANIRALEAARDQAQQ